MNIIKNIPLFSLLLLLYNAAAFGDTYQPQFTLETLVAQFTLVSGAVFRLNVGDVLLVAGVALLFQELLKATRTTKPYLREHLLSMAVFLIFIIEFFTVPQAGTVVFLLLTIMSLLDVIGGFTVTLSRHVVLPGTAAALAVAAAETLQETAEQDTADEKKPEDAVTSEEPTPADSDKPEEQEKPEQTEAEKPADEKEAEKLEMPVDLRKVEPRFSQS
ncbi:MAG: hypothetical protein HQL72_06300 [Magnetococcales bacterium]|nr:hypothetical protein [Magnetococcales bacterium]